MIQILDRISLQYAPSANETKEKRTIRKTHDTRTNYTENANEQIHEMNKRIIGV